MRQCSMNFSYQELEESVRSAFQAVANTDLKAIFDMLSDFHVAVSNDIAVVTCMLDQSYVLGGKLTTIVAPTTCVLRRDTGT